MPAATTHVEFAKDVYRILEKEVQNQITNMNMYLLGSQGPDMLFFSRGSLLPGSLHKYGDLMHNAKVRETVRFFEERSAGDPDLTSYLLGYLCHYALDSHAHPLVNAIAKSRHEQSGVNQSAAHVTMEADADVWIMHQRGLEISDYDVFKNFRVDPVSRKKLAQMYSDMFREIYDLKISAKRVSGSIRDIGIFTKVLTPNIVTNRLIYGAETLVHIPHSISGMMLTGKGDTQILNLDHTSYPKHYDSSLTISDSFPELYGKGALFAKKILKERSDKDFLYNFNGVPLKSA